MTSEQYVIFGSEYSPFSVKLRSYFRYKSIPHEWRPRTRDNQAEFAALAKLPLIPLVHAPDGEVLQDSTPIIEEMETRFPDPALNPADPTLQFLSFLLEDYADEWGNKPMFHYRWWRPEDQQAVGDGLARAVLPNGTREEQEAIAGQLISRMVPRLSFVGSHEGTKEIIEKSFIRLLPGLTRHLSGRKYLFGGKPALADFGLFGQLYCSLQQPTSEKIIRENAPEVLDWIDRMLSPEETGSFEDWATLAPTMEPLIADQIGTFYLPWAFANATALMKGQEHFSVSLADREFTQGTVKYSAKALHRLQSRLKTVEDRENLEEILIRTGCLKTLVAENW
ncbi:MAG: glutathione S-transferase [Alphaproteobacteria bacterium]|nr:MAG: glutathione S-transferase [Alphaproteobacteria bacterium]